MITITGTVKDKSGEKLPSANVIFTDKAGQFNPGDAGTITNNIGQYALTGAGEYVTASYTGYKTQTKAVARSVHFSLEPDTAELPEVIITATVIWPRIVYAIAAMLVLFVIYKAIK
jgi:hypothetical protein